MSTKAEKTLKFAAVVIGWVASIVFAVWAASANATNLQRDVADLKDQNVKVQQRLSSVEADSRTTREAMIEIRADVRWMRNEMEKRSP